MSIVVTIVLQYDCWGGKHRRFGGVSLSFQGFDRDHEIPPNRLRNASRRCTAVKSRMSWQRRRGDRRAAIAKGAVKPQRFLSSPKTSLKNTGYRDRAPEFDASHGAR